VGIFFAEWVLAKLEFEHGYHSLLGIWLHLVAGNGINYFIFGVLRQVLTD
jgi:hypothetical protein